MKILHVINSLDLKSGGPPRSLIPIANYQSKFADVTVISNNNNDLKKKYFELCNISFVIKKYSFPNLKSLIRLYVEIRKNEFIHIHNWWNFVSTFALIFSSILKKKIVLTPHGSLHDFNIKKSKLKKLFHYNLIDCFFINNINAIHYLTTNEKNNCFFLKKIKFKSAIIPNSISLNKKLIKPLKSNIKYFLYLGRLSQNKNIDFMIKCIRELKSKINYNFEFIIIGPDYGIKKNLLKLINELKLERNIKIIDPIYNDKRLSYLKGSEALFLASDYECNSIVVAEALALGTSIISTHECNTKDISDFGACITTSRNIKSFVKAIINLDDVKFKKMLQLKALEYSNLYLNINKNIKKLNDLYLSL